MTDRTAILQRKGERYEVALSRDGIHLRTEWRPMWQSSSLGYAYCPEHPTDQTARYEVPGDWGAGPCVCRVCKKEGRP